MDRTVLVVGGGVTGLTAALDAAAVGNDVVLIEKEAQLGGWMNKWAKGIPHASPYTEPQALDIADQVAAVEANEKITVHTGADHREDLRWPGQFDVTLKGNGSEPFRVGSIVQATGWKPYDANKLGHLGYGTSADVITNVQMEEMLASGKSHSSQRWKGPDPHRLHPVCRLQGPGPPSLLLRRLLQGHHQTGHDGP